MTTLPQLSYGMIDLWSQTHRRSPGDLTFDIDYLREEIYDHSHLELILTT